jgi:nucleotide-binding universal stress UspA family protein
MSEPAREPASRRPRVVLALAPDTPAEAVDTAFGLAAERGLPLLAVRAWHEPDVPLGGWLQPHGTRRWDAAHQKARHELDQVLAPARADHPSVEMTTVVVDDDLVAFLTALSIGAELLVLGRPTRRGEQASPADAVIREAACPVLVVPQGRRSATAPGRTLAASGS